MADVLLRNRDDRDVVTLTLHRPEARNALSPQLMDALQVALAELAADATVRVLVLTGAGEVFCAGGDLHWMRASRDALPKDHLADSRRLADTFRAVDEFPAPVVGRMNGHAIAGGAGLLGACDIVVGVRGAQLGFSEVRLGIAPATISRIVVPRIGTAAARRWLLTGERFDATTAQTMGLVHEVVDREDLDDVVEGLVAALLEAGPAAVRATKALIPRVAADPETMADELVELIAHLRLSDEGQEGIAAFFERRPPAWSPAAGSRTPETS